MIYIQLRIAMILDIQKVLQLDGSSKPRAVITLSQPEVSQKLRGCRIEAPGGTQHHSIRECQFNKIHT